MTGYKKGDLLIQVTVWEGLTLYAYYISIYHTLCKFSFEIKESCLSDTRYLIQDVVSLHCGDKRMVWRCRKFSLPDYFFHDVILLEWGKRCLSVSNVNKVTVQSSFFHIMYHKFTYSHFQGHSINISGNLICKIQVNCPLNRGYIFH